MALLLSVPSGLVGGQVALASPPTGQVLSPVVELFGIPDPAYGAQAAWSINPGTGSDTGPGTPAAPLRTMAEFSRRYTSLLVTVPATLQLVGDVLDSPLWLTGTRFALGAGLTVSGTATTIATATVSVVSGLGPAGTLPWQLTTTGIDWTLQPVASQLTFSTGHVSQIVQVIDANNVIVGALCAAGFSTAIIVPTVASTITVSSLSRSLPPILSFTAALGVQSSVPTVIVKDVSIDSPGSVGVNDYVFASGSTQLFGCELKSIGGTLRVDAGMNLRGCRWSFAGANTASWRAGPDNVGSFGLVVVGPGAALFNTQYGQVSHGALTLNGARLLCNNAKLVVTSGGCHIRNTAGPVLINDAGTLLCSTIINGATGNTGIGIDVTSGGVVYSGGGNKPTVTGASDTRVGGVARTYAQIPFYSWQLDAIPPTVTTLLGNGPSYIVQQ